jgi:hypothetical protein
LVCRPITPKNFQLVLCKVVGVEQPFFPALALIDETVTAEQYPSCAKRMQ